MRIRRMMDSSGKNVKAGDMRYIVSDIHGCYDQYRALLKKIHFTDADELYVLGDVVDRGPEPIKVLQDMRKRPNVIFILGNHDFAMYSVMRKFAVEVTEENYDSHLTGEDILDLNLWLQDGGQSTMEKFRGLNRAEMADILDYIAEASLYEIIEHNGKEYRLVHAGLANFAPDKELDEYELHELLEERADYSRRYYPQDNNYLVTGHTPTIYIEGWNKPEVYRKHGQIALDCACVAGGRLAAFCVETEEVTYVDGRRL